MKRRTFLTIANPNTEPEKFATASLADAPEDVLQFTRPRLAPDFEISMNGDEVTATNALADCSPVVLFSLVNEAHRFFFNCFNGKQSLFEVAKLYADEHESSYADSLQSVTDFARDLYQYGVLVPVNPGVSSC